MKKSEYINQRTNLINKQNTLLLQLKQKQDEIEPITNELKELFEQLNKLDTTIITEED